MNQHHPGTQPGTPGDPARGGGDLWTDRPGEVSFARYPAGPPQPGATAAPSSGNGMAVASLVTGIVALCGSLLFLPGIAAIVLGALGVNRANRTPAGPGRGMAVAGIVMGSVSIVLGIGLAVAFSIKDDGVGGAGAGPSLTQGVEGTADDASGDEAPDAEQDTEREGETPARAEKVPAEEPEKTEPAAPEMTLSEEQAVLTAENYLDTMPFSRSGLVEQLVFEQFSEADAEFAVGYIDVNWKQQAARSAENYLDSMSFSRQGLIDQLVFEGYTQEQATYGVAQTGL